jgi:hypothetical protein
MKKSMLIIFGLFMLISSSTVQAQSKAGAEYFNGKWSVLLKGTPNGDVKMIFVLESKNDSISGIVQDLLLTKKDADNVTGSLMNMFEAEGERVKKVVVK